MMRYLIFLFLLAFTSCKILGQDSSKRPVFTLTPIKELTISASQIYVDAVGFIYLIQNKNRILKLNPKLDSIAVFNNTKRYGNISYIDVNNPLRNIVYFQKYNSLYLLDRFLNTTSNINLRNIQINPPIWVCSSIDNDIWVYSSNQAKLTKINNKGIQQIESIDLRLLKITLPTPAWLYDNGKNIFLYDSSHGFYVFNRYGNFEKIIPLKNLKNIHYYRDNIWGILDGELIAISNNFEIVKQSLPRELYNASYINRYQNKVYVVQQNKLKIYEVN